MSAWDRFLARALVAITGKRALLCEANRRPGAVTKAAASKASGEVNGVNCTRQANARGRRRNGAAGVCGENSVPSPGDPMPSATVTLARLQAVSQVRLPRSAPFPSQRLVA